MRPRRDLLVGQRNPDDAAIRHRLDCVERKVLDGLGDLILVYIGAPEPWGHFILAPNVGSMKHRSGGFPDSLGQCDVGANRIPSSCEGQELLGEIAGTEGGPFDLP